MTIAGDPTGSGSPRGRRRHVSTLLMYSASVRPPVAGTIDRRAAPPRPSRTPGVIWCPCCLDRTCASRPRPKPFGGLLDEVRVRGRCGSPRPDTAIRRRRPAIGSSYCRRTGGCLGQSRSVGSYRPSDRRMIGFWPSTGPRRSNVTVSSPTGSPSPRFRSRSTGPACTCQAVSPRIRPRY